MPPGNSASVRWAADTRLRDSRRGDLAQLLDDAVKPLRTLVTGGRLDLSALWIPGEPTRYAALTFEGVLTSDQIVVVPNRTQWWWVRNETTGPFALRVRTSSGAPSIAISQGDAWQLVQCDGNDNIVLSPAHIQRKFCADGWFGDNRVRALSEIFRVARVPMDRISDELGFEISLLVEDAMLEQRIRNLKQRKGMRVPLKRIAYLRRELMKAFGELDDEILYATGFNRVSIVGALTVLLDVPFQFLATSRSRNRPSNRPRGSTANPALRRLILNLYIAIVEGAQGKLTLYGGKGEAKGTLPAILGILRPYLPDVIPANLPYETLRDIRKSARQAQQQWARK